jgi:hypothetical protein
VKLEKRVNTILGSVFEVVEYGIEVMPKLLAIDMDAIFYSAGDNIAQVLMTVTRDCSVHFSGWNFIRK